MGIRYSAYPVHPFDIQEAQACGRCYLSRDPAIPEWERRKDVPDYLDLDKCWGELQMLFALPAFKKNPARTLVQGAVKHTNDGWVSHYTTLSPDEVRDVAKGLSKIGENDVRANIEEINRFDDEPEAAINYIVQYLEEAKTFTSGLAQAGYGLVYRIG